MALPTHRAHTLFPETQAKASPSMARRKRTSRSTARTRTTLFSVFPSPADAIPELIERRIESQTEVATRFRLFIHVSRGRAKNTAAKSTVMVIGVRTPGFTSHQ